ncbi:MAG: DUF2490 domain-containing protein [Planctomycetota bacterium]|nr:MAG: DUF2490 domain-containing protein [Planctomycetota bacterium]
MSKSLKIRVCLVAALICGGLLAKPALGVDKSGFQYWSAAGFNFDLDKEWTVTFEEQFRLGDEGGNLYYHHSDISLVYKGFADWLDVGAGFRKAYEDRDGTWRQENRPHISVTLKGKLGDIAVSTRSRFEYRHREQKEDVWRYRNKVTFKLPCELTELKLKPYLADEVFINFNDEEYAGNRFYSGVAFNITKNVKADIYYLWQSSRATPGRDDIHALGTKLTFRF